MAKKSISDIVLRAVVDTSGVAQGLNNIGAQVAGRTYGTGQGGPTGASGAAGGFVNPHGGGAGPGVAAVAAAAAAGVTVARGVGGAGPGGAAMREAMAVTGNPLTNLLSKRYVAPRFRKQEDLLKAAKVAQDAGSDMAARAYVREALREGAAGAMASRRLSRFAESRVGRFTGGAIGGLSGMGDRIGAFTQKTLDRGGPLGGLTRFAGMMGMGRFAGVGGFGLAAGAPVAGAAMAYGAYQNRYNSVMDISRFNFGEDRRQAMRMRQAYYQPGKKAPLDLMDRFWLGAYKASPNELPWMERAVQGFGTPGEWAENTGARMATWSTWGGIARELTLYNTVDSIVQSFRRMFN
jgi:hypothetical protein